MLMVISYKGIWIFIQKKKILSCLNSISKMLGSRNTIFRIIQVTPSTQNTMKWSTRYFGDLRVEGWDWIEYLWLVMFSKWRKWKWSSTSPFMERKRKWTGAISWREVWLFLRIQFSVQTYGERRKSICSGVTISGYELRSDFDFKSSS